MEAEMMSILKGIQGSRPNPDPVLYGGALQENTDQYFRPSRFHNADDVPPPPKNLFCEYGATFEVDKRPFMTPQPQVPRDPELEALNEYFNKQRVLSYVRGFSAQVVGETIAKQAEQVANNFVKDEIDRRAGIRKNVLVNAGVSEADADRQIAGETLAGINTRTMDMRDRQITDAVNLYYNLNNIPPPATQPQAVPNRATLPTGAAGAIPPEEAEAMAPGEEDVAGAQEQERDQDFAQMEDTLNQLETGIANLPAAGGGPGVPTGDADAMTGFPQEEDFGRADEPAGWGGAAEGMPAGSGMMDPTGGDRFNEMNVEQLIQYIRANDVVEVGITADRSGTLYSNETMRRKGKAMLLMAVQEFQSRPRAMGAAAAPSAVANPKF